MAFAFNWQPLTAPATSPEFYANAKQLLSEALNNSPGSSAILESEIVVKDLDLGSRAPEIEILEIGDLADDRFRGVFRIRYDGDARLALRTKVQINPLNAYLQTAPSWTRPDTLAAALPLSIPLDITLSEIRLSGFVILVFSRSKGITLVFRNDPLESLSVRSTFDSIPSINSYLQDEIERQVRGLFEEELPMAVYRLSLRMFNPEGAMELDAHQSPAAQSVRDSEAASGVWDDDEGGDDWLGFGEMASDAEEPFSKSIIRLRALMNSQRTLSLFTPCFRGILFRAKPASSILGLPERNIPTDPSPTPIASDSGVSVTTRSSLSTASTSAPITGASGPRRKRKRRVINLRKEKYGSEASETASEFDDDRTVASAPEPFEQPQQQQRLPEPLPMSDVLDAWRANVINTPSLPQLRVNADVPLPTQTPPPTPTQCCNEQVTAAVTPTLSMARESRPLIRPRLADFPRHPNGMLEKNFMVRLVSELQRKTEGNRRHARSSRGGSSTSGSQVSARRTVVKETTESYPMASVQLYQ